MEKLSKVRARCKHVRDEDEGKPWWDAATQKWVYPSAEEAEYTAELAYQLAIASSMWAVRARGYELKVPEYLVPKEVGARVGWTAMSARTLRSNAMKVLGVQLGLTPPCKSPGGWFPKEYVAEKCTVRCP